jgi:hypothetical protein
VSLPRRISRRWHFSLDGKTSIVYGSKTDAQKAANALSARMHCGSHVLLEPSGFYDYDSNTIVDAADGPTLYVDNSGGKL